MSQKTSYAIKDTSVVTKIIGLEKAVNPCCHDPKNFDHVCHECIKDRDYLLWAHEG